MDKKQLVALSDFMREQSVTASDLFELAQYAKFYNGVPIMEEGEEFPIALRYADDKISKAFAPMHHIKSVHLENVDIGLDEFSIPMSYLLALQNCRQLGNRLMTEEQAKAVYKNFEAVNNVLVTIGADKLKKARYWVETPASKSYLAKAFDFETGKIIEVKRSESCRVRPIVFL